MFKFSSLYLSGALGALLMLSNVSWYIAYDKKGDALVKEATAHLTTKSNYKQAQLDAEIKAYKDTLEKERKNAEKSREADEAYGSLLDKYNASLLRYQRYQAAQRTASTIDLSSTSTTSSGSDSTSESTRILITMSDAGICAENTARLQAVRKWALEK